MPTIEVHGPHSKYWAAAVFLKQNHCQKYFIVYFSTYGLVLNFSLKKELSCILLRSYYKNLQTKKSWKIFTVNPPPRHCSPITMVLFLLFTCWSNYHLSSQPQSTLALIHFKVSCTQQWVSSKVLLSCISKCGSLPGWWSNCEGCSGSLFGWPHLSLFLPTHILFFLF